LPAGRGLIKAKGVAAHLGVKPQVIFAPFGRYLINMVKLGDDIVTVCNQGGTKVSSLPTKRVSVDLANVLRKIVSNQKPTFSDLTALNDEDKKDYNTLLRKCHILADAVDVPQDNDREDLNQFEIMKGEILSGNDSRELVKKFKVLLVKLTHNGRLPKGQAKGLLMDLAELGY